MLLGSIFSTGSGDFGGVVVAVLLKLPRVFPFKLIEERSLKRAISKGSNVDVFWK
jgi:hypothetical protein